MREVHVVLYSLVLSILGGPSVAQDFRPADWVLRGGEVYTVDAARRWAEAVAVSDGKLVYVGTSAGATAFVGSNTRVVELEGKMVLPGFHDSHLHPVSGGVELGQCNLSGIDTAAAALDDIEAYAEKHPDRPWILGGGWDLPLFPPEGPHKRDLDRIVSDRPAFVTAADGHSAWVNTKALELAGVDRDTPDPPNGRIERDPLTGEPTGTLREAAMDLFQDVVPEPTAAERVEGLRRALASANSFGITSLVEASASDSIGEAYLHLSQKGELSARVLLSLYVDPQKDLGQIDSLFAKRRRYQGDRLRADSAKLFVDGVIEAKTAALLEPYVGGDGTAGDLIFSPEVLKDYASRLDREGFQIHIHAIGDRAIRVSLDALEAAVNANGITDGRHHLAHIELFHPADISRFRKLGVLANFQPLWAYADTYITDMTEPIVGPQRARFLYPIGSLHRSGAVIVGGSDWSVSSMNPLDAMQVAVTRQGLEAPRGEPWLPHEKVTLPAMIAAYTINGAYLKHEEAVTGSLEVGKFADLIVLDRNLFDVPVEGIHDVKVLLTLLEGDVVFAEPSFSVKVTP